MLPLSAEAYMWWKVAHVIAIVTWMAGLFYLPRLYVYHAMSPVGSDQAELLKVMERRLLRGIMHPSLVAVLISGGLLLPNWIDAGWMYAKLALVGVLVVCHILCARWRIDFARDRNARSHVFYRFANEVPTVALIGIVILVIVKPF